MRERETKSCVICATTIERPPGLSDKQWKRRSCCSTVCQGRLHSIRMSRPKPHLRKPLTERLFARRRVDEETGCWEWTGTRKRGYGYIDVENRSRSVHRVAYEHFVGPIAEGLEMHHECRNRACFNPDHLRPLDRLAHEREERKLRLAGKGAA